MRLHALRRRALRPQAALPLLLFLLAVPVAQAIRPPDLGERPLWQKPRDEHAALRASLPSQSLVADPAPHPLDLNWVGMGLPTLFPLVTPIANAEFQGLLYLAGSFVGAGHVPAHSIVGWDGQQFVNVGDPDMHVQSLVAWNGALYAGGSSSSFNRAEIRRWDGATWTQVAISSSGPGPIRSVKAMEVWNGDLVAIGTFPDMGGVAVSRAARFDGTTWTAMGTGLATVSFFFDLQSVGSALYAAVNLAGGIRRWDGTDWVVVGTGLNSNVSQMTTDGTDLYAAGGFSKAGADSVPGVGRWDGSQWHRVGVGTQGASSIRWWNGQLVAEVPDGPSRLSRFDGVNWSGLGGPFTPSNGVNFLGTHGSKLVALGFVLPVPSGDAYSGAIFDGVSWSPLREAWEPGMHGLDRSSYAATVWNDKLVVAGYFTRVGTGAEMLRSVSEAMWDGSSWSTFGTGSGAGSQPLAITTWGSKLAVAGYVSATIPGGGTRSAASWDGSAWSVLVPGMFPYGYAAIEHAGDLVVGGDFFQTDGGVPVTLNGLARWTGSDWESVGGGIATTSVEYDGIVYALASWNDQIAVGGSFDRAGSAVVDNLALWDGTQWSDAGGGLEGRCFALEVWNGVLVAGGDITEAGGAPASGAAYWDGSTWHAMGDEAVEVDGLGQLDGTLYAVGNFRHADGSISNTVARWTGTNWAVLGSGAREGSTALLWVRGYHGDLYAGGQALAFAFGKASHGIIRLPAANTVGVDDGPSAAHIALVASPNPSGRQSSFAFTLPKAGRARLQVFDAAGRVIATLADGEMLAGPHQVRWSTPASPGVYFARLEAPGGERAITRVARTD